MLEDIAMLPSYKDAEWWKKPSVATWLCAAHGKNLLGQGAPTRNTESATQVVPSLVNEETSSEDTTKSTSKILSDVVCEEALLVDKPAPGVSTSKILIDLPEQESSSLRKLSCDSWGGKTASTSAPTPMRGSISSDLIDDDVFALESTLPAVSDGRQKPSFLKEPLLAPPQTNMSTAMSQGSSRSAESLFASCTFQSINQHVQLSILTFLHGYEATVLAGVARFVSQRLQITSIWDAFFEQEAIPAGVQKPDLVCSKEAYYDFIVKASCRSLVWHRVPCSHALGAREGSPAVFHWRGFLFVYGGWGRMGPVFDLHAGLLKHPLVLKRIPITGRGPPQSYEMQVTLLLDSSDRSVAEETNTLQVAVTGGYRSGGYRNESDGVGILELSLPQGSDTTAPNPYPGFPMARWFYTGSTTPRSNHTATYVPPRVSGSRYKEGCLLLFGGNVHGRAVNTVDVLDLEDMSWELDKSTSGRAPTPRNSHSALLLPARDTHEILVLGGGTGDATNGGPPRGGSDLHSAHWLDPKNFCWRSAPEAEGGFFGRGHVAVNLYGTAVVISGGRHMHLRVSAFSGDVSPSSWEVTALSSDSGLPMPRILGGGCALPDGTIIIYGGWHPVLGTFDDLWAARVDGALTNFCVPLCVHATSEAPTERPPIRRKAKKSSKGSSWRKGCQKFCKIITSAFTAMRSHCFGTHEYNEVASMDSTAFVE